MRIGTTLRLATAPTMPHTFRPGQRQLAGRCIAGERRARSQGGAATDTDRRDQLGIRADKHVVLYHGAVLVRAVVVAHDCARTDVNVLPDLAVADIGQMVGLGALADAARLHFDEIADVHLGRQPRARAGAGARVRADAAVRADV